MKQGGGGILSRVRNRSDALKVVTHAALVFLAVAAVMLGMYIYSGARTLIDVGFFSILGLLLWRFRSPAAAFGLLLVSVMRLLVTTAQSLDTGQISGLEVAICVVVLFAAVRAVEATLKLIGRFAEHVDG
ncbi:MAG: hypothetical protein ABL878_08060 [Burkholderiales bacterium]|jgi:hypothetical protein